MSLEKPKGRKKRLLRRRNSVALFNDAMKDDHNFFAKHAERSYRMRVVMQSDIDTARLKGLQYKPPKPGNHWIVLVWQIRPGLRRRMMCQLPTSFDVDAPEPVCRLLYDTLCGHRVLYFNSEHIEEAKNFSELLLLTAKEN